MMRWTISCLRCCILGAVGMFLCTGCAFVSRDVLLRNTMVSSDSSSLPVSEKVIVFSGLKDSRTEPVIGHVQNGYGAKTASVRAINDVQEWVNTEIAIRLRQNGFAVVDSASESERQPLTLNGEILKVYTTAYFTYNGEVAVMATFQKNGNLVLQKKYTGASQVGTNWVASAEAFASVLDSALIQSVDRLVHDADSLYRTVEEPATTTGFGGSETDDSLQRAEKKGDVSKLCDQCSLTNNGVVILSGNRTPSTIKQKMLEVSSEARRVFNRRAETSPDQQGLLCVHVVVDRKGNVISANIVSSNIDDEATEETVLKEINRLSFYPKPRDSVDSEVLFTMHFSHQDAKIGKGAYVGCSIGLSLLLFLLNMMLLN